MHVLGNVVILALVGVPLEQRLGTKRFALIYFIGLLGGSLGWVVFNADSYSPLLAHRVLRSVYWGPISPDGREMRSPSPCC